MSVSLQNITNGIRVTWSIDIYNNYNQECNTNLFSILNHSYRLQFNSNRLYLQYCNHPHQLKLKSGEEMVDGISKILVKWNGEKEKEMVRIRAFKWEPVFWPSNSYIEEHTFILTFYFQQKSNGGLVILKGLAHLLDSGNFSDVQFVVKNKKLLAHKTILAAVSPVLAAAFQTNWKEGQSQIVEISDTEPEIFEQFLKFAYTGETPNMSDDNIFEELFILADKYQVEFLKQACADYMCEKVTLENVLQYLIFSDRYSCSKLQQCCLQFIASVSKQVIISSEWKELIRNFPELAIKAVEAMVNK